MTHWNRYEPEKFRTQAMIDYYVASVRQFAMYRSVEDANIWEDADKRLGPWRDAFTGSHPTHPVCLINSWAAQASAISELSPSGYRFRLPRLAPSINLKKSECRIGARLARVWVMKIVTR